MEDLKTLQIESITFAVEYIPKLITAFRTIAEELKGNKKEDTFDLLNQAIEGLNVIIDIFNATSDIYHESEDVFNKEVIEQKIQNMNTALKEHDDEKTAISIETDIIPFLDVFAKIMQVYLANGDQGT